MRRICSGRERRLQVHELAQRDRFTRRRDQRRALQRFRRLADVRAQDDGQARLAVEIFAEPRAVAERAHDSAERRAVPADFGDAPVVGLRAQLQRLHVRVRERLHVRAGECSLQQLAAFLGRGVERGRCRWIADGSRPSAPSRRCRRTARLHSRTRGCREIRRRSRRARCARARRSGRRRRRARRSCRRPATAARTSS